MRERRPLRRGIGQVEPDRVDDVRDVLAVTVIVLQPKIRMQELVLVAELVRNHERVPTWRGVATT